MLIPLIIVIIIIIIIIIIIFLLFLLKYCIWLKNAFIIIFSIVGQARTAMKCFSSPEGDHITLINVYRASDEFVEKIKQGNDKEKTEKKLRKWCKENFINSRSLRHARDIHRLAR